MVRLTMNSIDSGSYILVVENDDFFAIKVEMMLMEIGYTQIKVVDNASSALLLVSLRAPTLVISDIYIEGIQTGIDLMNQLITLKIPCILMTQYENARLYEKANQNAVVPYLVKPFHQLTLKSTIDMLMERHEDMLASRTIFIRGSQNKQDRVNLAEILWIETDANYSYIYTAKRKYVLKKPLKTLLTELDKRFIRVHHSYAVNSMHITLLTATSVQVGSTLIPVSRTYKEELIRQIK